MKTFNLFYIVLEWSCFCGSILPCNLVLKHGKCKLHFMGECSNFLLGTRLFDILHIENQ